MTVHVLDTGAVYHLLNQHKPPLPAKLDTVPSDSTILIPAIVLTEANQVKALSKRRLEGLLEIADIEVPTKRVFDRASECLRAIERHKCAECSGFVGRAVQSRQIR